MGGGVFKAETVNIFPVGGNKEGWGKITSGLPRRVRVKAIKGSGIFWGWVRTTVRLE
jgi:hypothetical protein